MDYSVLAIDSREEIWLVPPTRMVRNTAILSAGDNAATGNKGGITGSGGLIKNSVTFTLGSLPSGFDLNRISNVSFQYGTALNEPNIPGHPVPDGGVTAMLLGGALVGLETLRRTLRA